MFTQAGRRRTMRRERGAATTFCTAHDLCVSTKKRRMDATTHETAAHRRRANACCTHKRQIRPFFCQKGETRLFVFNWPAAFQYVHTTTGSEPNPAGSLLGDNDHLTSLIVELVERRTVGTVNEDISWAPPVGAAVCQGRLPFGPIGGWTRPPMLA
ncbi:hypothetical protein OG21DRAFT_385333 [Imleria badia]|nr:hypothetical protein OG21DRAFT_385333 [Imleria badia]